MRSITLFLLITLLAIILFLSAVAAILAGAVGIAYALRWVWPAIDLGSATIASLIALLVTFYLAWRVIGPEPKEETRIDGDEDENEDDEEEARRIRRAIWRISPDTELYIPTKRRRRKRRG